MAAKKQRVPLVLAGDVGGTHTRLGLFAVESAVERRLISLKEYPSEDLESLESALKQFMTGNPGEVSASVFAVAGPIVDGHSKLTNLTWEVSEHTLKSELNTQRVQLINDQVGLAYFVAAASPEDHVRLNDQPPQPEGPVAILAPGTGLGEGFMTWDGQRYRPFPSEGGHADFAPVNAQQQRLLEFMLGQHARVSIERVCSGKGLANLYRFLRDVEGLKEPPWLRERLSREKDPVPVIVETARLADGSGALCAATLTLFIELLAQEAGNLALKLLPTGGLYLGGGIPSRILTELEREFLAPFHAKGRMEGLLKRIPVFVVTHDQPNLVGAANRAMQLLSGQ